MTGMPRVVVIIALFANALATGLAIAIPMSTGKQLGNAAIIHINDMWMIVIAAAIAFLLNATLGYLVLRSPD